ncbi:sensor histidine kinase [Microbacterium sp. NPDC055357]
MTQEGPSSLDDAWGHIPRSREATAGIGAFTRQRVERIISVSSGVGSLILGAQAAVTALGQRTELGSWQVPLLVVVFAPLLFMIVACLVGRGVRVSAGVFAIVYVAMLAMWPLATTDSTLAPTEAPWIWYLVNIATLAAVLAFSLPLQLVWTALAPLLFGFVRLVQGEFRPDVWAAVAIDVSFALILGGVLLSLGWVLRSIAVGVDDARGKAVESYARAAAANAAEQERVAVAALMHDSVLAALIAAERADGPRARTLAAAMAREALTRLANAEQDAREGSDAPQDSASLADDIEVAAREVGVQFAVQRSVVADAPSVPGRVARALVLATTQAIANAVQHAGGVGLTVTVDGTPERIRIVVRDAGEGFDMAGVPDDRLGIRGSIIARVAAVGGTAQLESSRAGTVVVLDWPAPLPQGVTEADLAAGEVDG